MLNDLYCFKFLFHDHRKALSLQFSRLITQNGFKKTGTVQALFFDRSNQNNKIGLKEVFDLPKNTPSDWKASTDQPITFGNNVIAPTYSRGAIVSKTHSISWDLKLTPEPSDPFRPIPTLLKTLGIIQTEIITGPERIQVEGHVTVNGEQFPVHSLTAQGQGRILFRSGTEHSWISAHCNQLYDEKGTLTDGVFEGLSMKFKKGPLILPQFSSFLFHYMGKRYLFNHLRDSVLIKSNASLTDWQFEASRGDLAFRGLIKAQHKDFSGFASEDTLGAFLYTSSSLLSDMNLRIYRQGKLETTLTSEGTTSLEIISRSRNPYVPNLL